RAALRFDTYGRTGATAGASRMEVGATRARTTARRPRSAGAAPASGYRARKIEDCVTGRKLMTKNSGSAFWNITLLSASLLVITMGVRQTTGLFVSPLNTSTGLGIVAISFALAIAQLVWGAVQPIAGALASRYGHAPVLACG